MTTVTKPRIVVPSPKAVEEGSFRISVRNNLSKVANAIGLDRWDREELMDLAESDRVLHHWQALIQEVGAQDIPEHTWNRHVRAATRACLVGWGGL